MKRVWKEQDINKALKQMAKAPVDRTVFDRAWFKLEDRIISRKKRVWQHIVWKPWVHPVRWVALACLCLGFTGLIYNQHAINETNDTASYLMSVSNPTANITHDLGMVNVSVLLSGPSNSASDIFKSDDEHTDVLSGDEILL